ncbi:MAG: hypothetical protein LBT00_14050 [Spirochaetaceae bacterium]|jgi:hypothetical protein|nr:hypothetical protein [Spirochaetaceae bacterium]
MGHRHIAFCAAFLFFSSLAVTVDSQEGEEADGQTDVSPVFPIHRLWQDAKKNTVRWQPDWPLAIPPDSFDPVSSGKARRVTITVQPPMIDGVENGASTGENAESPEPRFPSVYTARRDADGRLVEFPFLRDGVFYQASARYGRDETDGRVIEALTLALSPDASNEPDASTESIGPIEIVLLKTDEGRPVTARIKTGDASYFASFLWRADTCVEMWTDETGVPLEVLRDERIFHYDSMQNITFIRSADSPDFIDLTNDGAPGGTREVSARYNDKGPRYWTRDGTTLSFQRDETGLIVRLADIQEKGADTPQPPINSSYAYTFDQNGNWTERREIRWTKLNGYLVPSEGTVVTRLIEYAAP